jgi:hypothetical protein
MTNPTRRCLSGWGLAATLWPTVLGAQTVARSFEQLKRDLEPGQTVVVTDGTGAKTLGRVMEISESSLLLRTKESKRDASGHEHKSWGGQRAFAETDVTEINRKDSLWNGTLIGLGAGFGAVWLAFKADSCAPFPYDLCFNSYGAFPLLVYPTLGAIAGASIDRTTGNGKVYLAPSRSSARSVTLRPWLHRRESGVALSMTF